MPSNLPPLDATTLREMANTAYHEVFPEGEDGESKTIALALDVLALIVDDEAWDKLCRVHAFQFAADAHRFRTALLTAATEAQGR